MGRCSAWAEVASNDDIVVSTEAATWLPCKRIVRQGTIGFATERLWNEWIDRVDRVYLVDRNEWIDRISISRLRTYYDALLVVR